MLRVRDLEIGWAKAQELRDAIQSASQKGHKTVAWIELASFGANLEYFVASAADEVYTAPATRAPVIGLSAEYLFFGGLLDKLGIEIEAERIGRYKSAVETITGRGMSEFDARGGHRAARLDQDQFVAGIADSRKIGADAVREAIGAAPVDPQEMQKWGLIDGALHWDEMLAKLGDPEVVEQRDYAAVDPSQVGFAPKARFALIYGSGNVVPGKGSVSPSGNAGARGRHRERGARGRRRGSEHRRDRVPRRLAGRLGAGLRPGLARGRARARQGQAADRVVLRRRGVGRLLRGGGRRRDRRVAGSITGSIGVFALRPVLSGLYEKLESASTRWCARRTPTSSSPPARSRPSRARACAPRWPRSTTCSSTRVGSGRSLERDKVDAVGQGRVWTGAQARRWGWWIRSAACARR